MTDTTTEQPTYFHGGAPGLRPNQYILPPDVTGARSTSDMHDAPPEMLAEALRVHRRDRVYLTTDIRVASLWAALCPVGTRKRGGDVYRVQPIGDIEPDLDYLADDGASVQAPRALILGIVRTGVRRSLAGRLIGEVT